jgi:hypothetical protein
MDTFVLISWLLHKNWWDDLKNNIITGSISPLLYCLELPWFALICLDLPWFALYCLVLPCIALICLVLPCIALYCLVLPWIALICLDLPWFALICLDLPWFALFLFFKLYFLYFFNILSHQSYIFYHIRIYQTISDIFIVSSNARSANYSNLMISIMFRNFFRLRHKLLTKSLVL